MTIDLRAAAIDIFQHALRAVDAREAVRCAVTCDGTRVRIVDSEFDFTNRPIYVVGIGKAALSMSLGLNDVPGLKIQRAVISTSHSTTTPPLPSTYTLFYGGHPLPNQESLNSAECTFDLLGEAKDKDGFVIFLISGGGSAMLEWPISSDITLEDLQEMNHQLITSGATIAEINAVRRAVSAVKNGGLATRLPALSLVTLIVSDTNRGDYAAVASGPTIAKSDRCDALEVVERFRLNETLPRSVTNAISHDRTNNVASRNSPVYVLLDNSRAVEAARKRASDLGLSTMIAPDIVEQPVSQGVDLLLRRSFESTARPSCLISGGEFSCRVTGNGRGGRNLETALRSAIKLDEVTRTTPTVLLSAGTDGIDGSSFAAGAIIDETTASRAKELGLDPVEFLEQSDSHAFFEALGDLIVTGPTGTNVRDLRLVLTG